MFDKKEYQKKYWVTYRKQNKDRLKEYKRNYFQQNRGKIAPKKLAYYHTHKRKRWYKEMEKRANKKYYRKNKTKIGEQHKVYNYFIRKQVLEYYGGTPPKCNCCGESILDFLTIEHPNGGGTKHRQEVGEGTRFYLWLIKTKFPKGYTVLCYNCNCGKRNGQKCPHKRQKQMLEGRIKHKKDGVN